MRKGYFKFHMLCNEGDEAFQATVSGTALWVCRSCNSGRYERRIRQHTMVRKVMRWTKYRTRQEAQKPFFESSFSDY